MNPVEKQLLELKVIDALQTCYDPEIPVNIYELGLVYGIEISDSAAVRIQMTLTAPACPVAGSLPVEIESKLSAIEVSRALAWKSFGIRRGIPEGCRRAPSCNSE